MDPGTPRSHLRNLFSASFGVLASLTHNDAYTDTKWDSVWAFVTMRSTAPATRSRVENSSAQNSVDRRSNFSSVSLFSIELAFLENAASPSSSPFFAQSGLTYSLGGRFFGRIGSAPELARRRVGPSQSSSLSLNEESERCEGNPGLLVSASCLREITEPKPAPEEPPPAPDLSYRYPPNTPSFLLTSSEQEPQSDSNFNKSSMLCFGTPVWADRIRRGGDAGMAGGSLLVAIGEQGLNSLAVAVSFGDEARMVGGLFTGELGAAGGAGGSAKLGTKAGAAALGTKALAEACVDLRLAREAPRFFARGGRVARAFRVCHTQVRASARVLRSGGSDATAARASPARSPPALRLTLI